VGLAKKLLECLRAFQINTPYLFDSRMINRLRGTGIDTPSHWGWGNHYVWRLLAGMISTYLAAVLAGAIAKNRAGMTVAISNLPSIAIWVVMIFALASGHTSFIYGDQTITIHTGMIVAGVISIPLTTFFAYQAAEYGSKIQQEKFRGEGTVLGIAGYHWVWLIIPIYVYAVGSIAPIATFLTFSFMHDEGIVSGCIGFAIFFTAIASVFPVIWVIKRLNTPATTPRARLKAVGVNLAVLTGGMIAVGIVQLLDRWLIGKVAPFIT
jgi:hypothetical protein